MSAWLRREPDCPPSAEKPCWCLNFTRERGATGPLSEAEPRSLSPPVMSLGPAPGVAPFVLGPAAPGGRFGPAGPLEASTGGRTWTSLYSDASFVASLILFLELAGSLRVLRELL